MIALAILSANINLSSVNTILFDSFRKGRTVTVGDDFNPVSSDPINMLTKSEC